MPPVIAGAAAIAGTTIFGTVTIGSLVTTLAFGAGSFLLNKAFAPKPQSGGFIDQGHKILARQAVPTQRFILGRALVSGPLFFLEKKPPYLYYGIILASHEIDGVDEIRMGNTRIFVDGDGNATSPPYKDGSDTFFQVSIRNGTDDQAIDPILSADFPELAAKAATWRQRGHATAVCKMDYGNSTSQHEEIWGNEQPNPLFLVRGAKVYDPRKTSHNVNNKDTWEFSDNSSLCQAYYLTHSKGARVNWNDIDQSDLAIAADADDEFVALKDGTTEKRYTCNGVVDLKDKPIDIVNNLLTSNFGKLIWHNGKYRFISGTPRSAVWSLNDGDLRGAVEARYEQTRSGTANIVQTVFASSEREYQNANGPELRNETYIAQDGEEHSIQVELPFTDNHTRAQRIGKIAMEASRFGKQLKRKESIDNILMSASDIINVESESIPNINTTFEVSTIKLSEDGTEIEIDLEEYSDSIFAWDAQTDEQDFTLAPVELEGTS